MNIKKIIFLIPLMYLCSNTTKAQEVHSVALKLVDSCSVVSVQDVVRESLNALPRVFPNPATNQLNVSHIESIHRIELTDVNGRRLLVENQTAFNHLINLHDIEAGLYVLSIYCDKNIFHEKIVLKK